VHAGGFFDRIAVLYKASKGDHAKSYKQLKKEWKNVSFFRESFFYKFRPVLLIRCLHAGFPYTCFMVDDNLLFQDISDEKKNIFESFSSSTAAFSLRLGLNCTYSHPADKHFKIKNYSVNKSGFLEWKWREQEEGDFNYPLALDGHIFRTAEITSIIEQTTIMNPNSLEGFMQQSLDKVPDFMQSFEHSRLVGLPLNLVNDAGKNFYGKKYFYDTTDLCRKYLEGWRIDLAAMDFSSINSAHCELKLEFIRRA
jgi:hypothetical protein